MTERLVAEKQQETQEGIEAQLQVNNDIVITNEMEHSERPQRSQRVHGLTEKGQELRDERLKQLEHGFGVNYENWKTLVKNAKSC